MGSRTANQNPSFFKVLLGDFAEKLRIPDAFVKKFKQIMHQRTVNLKSNMRNSSLITVENSQNGFFFKRGWKMFVRRHNLQEFDFLVFNLIDKGTYEVVIFDSSGCEKSVKLAVDATKDSKHRGIIVKQANVKLTRKGVGGSRTTRKTTIYSRNEGNVRRGREEQDGMEKSNADHHQENSEENERREVAERIAAFTPQHPYFVHVFKGYQKYSLRMPNSFAMATGLAARESTVIEDPEGRKWPIGITVTYNGRQFHLSSGLRDFVEANGIVAWDTVVFHFRKGINVMDAQIHSKGRSNEGSQKALEGAVKSEPLDL